jgi:hypothetical protein
MEGDQYSEIDSYNPTAIFMHGSNRRNDFNKKLQCQVPQNCNICSTNRQV